MKITSRPELGHNNNMKEEGFWNSPLYNPSDGQAPLRGAGDKYSSSSVVVPLEETKICPKGMETVVWDGWTRPRRVRENSDKQPTTNQQRDSQDACSSSCLATIDELEKADDPLFMQQLDLLFCDLLRY